MKHITFILLLSLMSTGVFAQYIPDDPAFRVGRLDNGMTYYLYRNANPEGCADFYIAHNVGALQEEDNQNGLAHFLEHMAFNGTRHYPGSSLLDFLAKDGVRFGYNVNAYTSRTETVYNISSVPLVRESFIDSVMMILHDWSSDISCEMEALDAERGVISEEWRLRDDQRFRMMCRQTELIYRGGKQPERTVLGDYKVINGFKREEILDFYDKWYRPSLQAIIIVGDFELDAMEAKVKACYSDIKEPENAPAKPAESFYLPPRQDGPLFGNMLDKAVRFNAVKVIWKQPFPDFEQRHTEDFARDCFCRSIITSILGDRMREKTKSNTCPASSAVLVTSAESPSYYITLATITPRGREKMADCFQFVTSEQRRLIQHGISRDEFEIAKLNAFYKAHLDRTPVKSEIQSEKIVKVCVENFLRGYPLLDPAEEQQMEARILQSLTFEEVSAYIPKMFAESDVIYSNCANESEADKLPTREQVLGIAAAAAGEDTAPEYLSYPDFDFSVNPDAGSVKSEGTIKGSDIRRWKLSNGVTVFFRQVAPFRGDKHLYLTYEFPAGYRALPQDRIAASEYAINYIRRYTGFRGVDKTQARNYPELSAFSPLLTVKPTRGYIELSSSADKMEDAFKLMYLQIEEPFWPDEATLDKFKFQSLKTLSKGRSAKEKFARKSLEKEFGGHPWLPQIDSAAIQAVDRGMIEDIYRRCFGDVATMNVYITSDASEEEVRSLVCKYVASMKSDYDIKLSKPNPVIPAYRGKVTFEETNDPVSAPVACIRYDFSTRMKGTVKNRICEAILDHIMSARYLHLIREERGGTYHVGFATEFPHNPELPLTSEVEFQTRPELQAILLKDVEDVMNEMAASGPTEEEMAVAVKYLKKYNKEKKAKTATDIGKMAVETYAFAKYGIPYDYDYQSEIDKITAEDVRRYAAKINAGNKYIELYSEK